ncbi:MAG TPA: hypothetical protein VLK36_12325 [Gaiellaceae bacterium]|nr:hypothetical protein [Gaiellaceae bacterium]
MTSPRPLLVALVLGALLALPAAVRAEGPGDAVYRKLCRAIHPQHVRALFTGPVAPIRLGGSSDCAFSARGATPELDGIRVFLRIDDGDQTLWKHVGDRSYGTFRWLATTGRRAKWGYEGGRLPSVVDARRGTFTCTLIPAGEKGLAVPHGAPIAAAREYARRLLALCDDVFAARR